MRRPSRNTRAVWLTLLGAVSLATGALGAPPPVSPASQAFLACDGHAGEADFPDHTALFITGVSQRSELSALPALSTIPLDGAKVAACDRALADASLTPDAWLRRVNLLQARGVHHFAGGDFKAGLADLDAAEAAAKGGEPQALYQRSLQVSIDLLRAWGLVRLGRQGEADALALEAVAARPYSMTTYRAAIAAVGPKADAKVIDALLRGYARLHPEALMSLYLRDYDAGRFEQALAYRDALLPVLDESSGGTLYEEIARAHRNHARWELFWVARAGEQAYAFAARGQADAARNAIAESRAHLAALSAVDKTPEDIAADTQLVIDGGAVLDRWARLAQMRIDVFEGRAQAAAARFKPEEVELNGATVELLRAISTAAPTALTPALNPATAAEALARLRARQTDTSLAALVKALPDPQNWVNTPRYKPLGKYGWGWRYGFGDDFNGIPASTYEAGGDLHYTGVMSTRTLSDEMALMRAADLARLLHKSLLIESAILRQRVRGTSYYGRPVGNVSQDGWDAEVQVLFVDPDKLPQKHRGAPWRVINAEEVYAALTRVYPAKN
jgi:hypothetical protein